MSGALEAAAVAVVALVTQALVELGDLEAKPAELTAAEAVTPAAAQLEADLLGVAAQAEGLAARKGAALHRALDPGIDPVEVAAQLNHGLPAAADAEAAIAIAAPVVTATILVAIAAIGLRTAVAIIGLLGAALAITLRHGRSSGEGGRNDRERNKEFTHEMLLFGYEEPV